MLVVLGPLNEDIHEKLGHRSSSAALKPEETGSSPVKNYRLALQPYSTWNTTLGVVERKHFRSCAAAGLAMLGQPLDRNASIAKLVRVKLNLFYRDLGFDQAFSVPISP